MAGKRRLLCFSVRGNGAREQTGTVYKELKQEMKKNSIFNYVSSEAHVHCLKADFEILSIFELEQENSFFPVLHLTCIQSRFGWVPHLNC